jgi:heme/copper-type cytochrome/quinol oxidase subunit 2
MDDRTQTRDSVLGPILLVMGIVGLLVMGLFIGWVVRPATSSQAVAAPSHYTPQTRPFTMTIVPYWVHEVTGTYDYLAPEFGKHGLLAGKEVWGFAPSSIAVYQGDTVHIDLYNPSSDPHTWSLPDLGVNVNVGATAKTVVSFVASKVGTFTFNCEVGEHFPFMSGQLLVLPASAAPQN